LELLKKMGLCCSLLCACCPDGGYSSLGGVENEFDGIDMGMGTGYYQSSRLPALDGTSAAASSEPVVLPPATVVSAGSRYDELSMGMGASAGTESKSPSPVKKAQPLAINSAPAKSGLFVRYNILEVVGEGSTSKCHKAIRKADGAIYACKIIDKRNVSSKFNASLLDQLLVETRVLQLLKQQPEQHPNIVQLEDHYETTERTYLVVEMLSGGELLDYIASCGTLTEAEAAVIISQIISVVQYLHSLKIIHRDLKPENFLLAQPRGVGEEAVRPTSSSSSKDKDKDSNTSSTSRMHSTAATAVTNASKPRIMIGAAGGAALKLIDFGLAKLLAGAAEGENASNNSTVVDISLDKGGNAKLSAAAPVARTFLGTTGYMAPEIFQRQPYDASVDMWSVGVIAYIVLIGCMPFDADTDIAAKTSFSPASSTNEMKRLFKLSFPMWAGLSAGAKDLLSQLLEVDSAKRLSAEQALAHPWLQPDGASKDKYLQSPVLLGERDREAKASEDIHRKLEAARRDMK